MSRTLIVLVAGLLVSGGALTLVRALVPRALPLEATLALAETRRPIAAATLSRAGSAESTPRGARLAWTVLGRLGYDVTDQEADLRILHLDHAQFALYKLSGLLVGAFSIAVASVSLGTLGVGIGAPWVLALGLAGSVIGYVLPDRWLAAKAAEARVDFDAAFTAYLELVRTLIAGGMNVQGALHVAAQAGEGPAFDELVIAIDRSVTGGTTIATEFARLGREADLPEVAQVASTLDLAAEQGAAPSDALASRAETLTTRRAYEEREAAERATAKMSIPTALLALGYVLLLGAPAVAALFSSTEGANLP